MSKTAANAAIPDDDEIADIGLTPDEIESLKLGPEVDAEEDFAGGAIERDGGKQPEQRGDPEEDAAAARAAAEKVDEPTPAAEPAVPAEEEQPAEPEPQAEVKTERAETRAAAIVPPLVAAMPVDAKAQMDQIGDAIDALEKRFDEGEIERPAYRAELRKLEDQRLDLREEISKARLAAEMQQQAAVATLQQTVQRFYADHPDLDPENLVQRAAIDAAFGQIDGTEEVRGLNDRQILDKAYDIYLKSTGRSPPAPAPAKPPAKRVAAEDADIPPTLGRLPAAAHTETDDGRFAWLERLKGPAFDAAVAGMSAADRAAYEAM